MGAHQVANNVSLYIALCGSAVLEILYLYGTPSHVA